MNNRILFFENLNFYLITKILNYDHVLIRKIIYFCARIYEIIAEIHGLLI